MKLIYLLGAGRSGTTILATMLNANPDITSVGEMHQFYDHLFHNKPCSCGNEVYTCSFWGNIVREMELSADQLKEYKKIGKKMEAHSKIPFYLLGWKADKKYDASQELIFRSIQSSASPNYILDSSKYIARYLLLCRNDKITPKGIYVVRDVRGVINSFKKNVQTPKSSLSTILYHSLINFFGQLVCWIDHRVIKIRYEDLMTDLDATLKRIHEHIFGEDSEMNYAQGTYTIPHIIGGNRLKNNTNVTLKFDQGWKNDMSRLSQLMYAFLAMPFMWINKYSW